jgi:hypothetical protein
LKTGIYGRDSLAKYLAKGYVVQTEDEDVVVLVRNRKVGVFWNLVLTLVTGGWWAIVWIYKLITKNSVATLYKNSSMVPVKASSSLAGLFDGVLDKFKGSNGQTKIITVAGLGVIFLVFSLVDYGSKAAEADRVANLAYSKWSKGLETPIDQAACSNLDGVVKSGDSVALAKSVKDKAIYAEKKVGAYDADTYISKNSWVDKTDFLLGSFEKEVGTVTNPILASKVKQLANEKASSSFEQSRADWQESFKAFAISDCGLEIQFEKSQNLVSQVQGAAVSIQQTAANEPWYPQGFEALSAYPGYAYKNAQSGCSYSFGSCATFKIVAKDGCPGTLYIETNLTTSSGEVIDWGNDTARGLGRGQIAAMETTFTKDGGGSWQITDLSCY